MGIENYINDMEQSRRDCRVSCVDDDYLIALQLQEEYDRQAQEANPSAAETANQGSS